MNGKPSEFKRRIEGTRVSSVLFVEDYLQMIFDDYGLTLYVWPEIEKRGIVMLNGQAGYRDALCNLINCRVIEATEKDDEIAILFTDGSYLTMSLRPEDRAGPESGLFFSQMGSLTIVWT